MSVSVGSPALPPRALIVTLFGLYARESGGWLSVATLVKLLAQVGVDEPAVRSAISRLKRRGVIAPERVDGSAGYTIGEHTRRMLDLGDRRIFDRRQPSLTDGWLLAVFSVPEAERDQRHLLRSRLAWLGFGTVSAGTWIAPQHLEDEAREALDGFGAYVELFRADHLGFGVLPEKIATWWDLARTVLAVLGLRSRTLRRSRVVATAPHRRRRRRVRRLRAHPHRLAAPAVPRPGPARVAAPRRLGRHPRRRDLRGDPHTPGRPGTPLRRCSANLRHPYPSRRSALVAQGIERRTPKPGVAGSNPAGGTLRDLRSRFPVPSGFKLGGVASRSVGAR